MIDRSILFFLALGVLSVAAAVPVQAQESSDEPAWEAAVDSQYDRLSTEGADWQRWTALLRRDLPGGSISATVLRQRRFDVVDEAGALDLWQGLWPNAYGHLGVGIGPTARVLPRRNLTAEVYQSIGTWELLAHYGWRRYANDDVHLFGPGLARYVGAWYLRVRTTVAPRPESWAVSQRLGIRRYYSWTPSTSYVDLEAGVGRSVELVSPDTDLLVARTLFGSLRVRHFVTPRLGLTVAVRYSDDGPFARTGGTLGLVARW